MARIFISHSSRNNAEAIAVRDWLAAEGWDDVFLDLDPEQGIQAGDRWQEALRRSASRCELVIFLVSPEWVDSRWCLAELLLAKQLNKRLVGVLVRPTPFGDISPEITAEWQITDLTADGPKRSFVAELPTDGTRETVVFTHDGLERLKIGLLNAGLDARYFPWPPKTDPERPPYRGLLPLDVPDAGIFFGRDAPIVDITDVMRGLREAVPPQILVILGASGAGKSSFLRAGLLARLERDDRHFTILPTVRPHFAAMTGDFGLVASLESFCASHGAKLSRAVVRDACRQGAEAVRALLAPHVETHSGERAPTLVLPIDQGEELFRTDGAAEAQAFLDLVRDLLGEATPAVLAVVTIRSDSYEALQSARALEGVHQTTWSLPPMPRGTYGQVIEGPARRLAQSETPLKIDSALTDALLADIEAGGSKDALPLLAYTLERLWREHGGDGQLTLGDYESMGRIRGAIEAAVEQALRAADANRAIPREHAARLALLRRALIPWLAGIDPESGAPRRRIARRTEIPEEARPLVDLLVEQRLLSTDVDHETGEVTVEPAHEALLRQWGLLEGWLEEDFEDLSVAEGVKRAAREWLANDRDTEWRDHAGGRLELAEQVAAREDFERIFEAGDRAYLAACAEAERAIAEEEAARKQSELLAAKRLAAAHDGRSFVRSRPRRRCRRCRLYCLSEPASRRD